MISNWSNFEKRDSVQLLRPQDIKGKRVLISPLDWGLGHATRCIPVIRTLLKNNNNVVIAAEGAQEILLKEEFPNLEFIHLAGYRIRYQSSGSFVLQMLKQIPKILNAIRQEKESLASIIKKHHIEVVISDNRYGLYNKNVYSVFITHQLFIKVPFFKNLAKAINHSFIRKFNACWVPDHKGENNLSGELSHGNHLPSNVIYIGPLSRFSKASDSDKRTYKYKFIAIISGPEPQRSLFEQKITDALLGSGEPCCLIRGLPGHTQNSGSTNLLEIHDHLSAKELQVKIENSEIVIARSGYSTIMDLHALNKKAIYIPTSGQTEQEYLAKYHQENNLINLFDGKDLIRSPDV